MTNDVAGTVFTKKNVLICDTQPVAVEGMKWLIENSGDLQFGGAIFTLKGVYELLNPEAARIAAELAAAEPAAAELAAAEAALRELQASEQADVAVNAQAVDDPSVAIEACGQEPVEEISPVMETIGLAGDAEACADSAAVETSAVLCEETSELSPAEPLPVELLPVEPLPIELLPIEPLPIEPAPIAIPIDAVVIDKGLGLAGVMELLHKLASTSHTTPAIVWGAAISESEALRLLQAGARGILRRTSESDTLLTCLRAVTAGGTWMEDGIFGSTEKLFNPRRSQLTQRESEVVVLVEKGFRNRDIAKVLGIQTGTVKIHLKHIFEKTGVRGRYGLAFTGLQNKGTIPASAPPQMTV